MTKYEISITLNLGNYESARIGVSDCESFEECQSLILDHLTKNRLPMDKQVRKVLGVDK